MTATVECGCCVERERSEMAVNRHAHIQSPGHSGEGPGLGSGLEEENKNRMQRLQQGTCQATGFRIKGSRLQAHSHNPSSRSCCEHAFTGWDFALAFAAMQPRISTAVG